MSRVIRNHNVMKAKKKFFFVLPFHQRNHKISHHIWQVHTSAYNSLYSCVELISACHHFSVTLFLKDDFPVISNPAYKVWLAWFKQLSMSITRDLLKINKNSETWPTIDKCVTSLKKCSHQKGLLSCDTLKLLIVWFHCLQVSPGPLSKKYSSCSTIFIDDNTVSQPNLKSTIKWWEFHTQKHRHTTLSLISHEKILLHHSVVILK